MDHTRTLLIEHGGASTHVRTYACTHARCSASRNRCTCIHTLSRVCVRARTLGSTWQSSKISREYRPSRRSICPVGTLRTVYNRPLASPRKEGRDALPLVFRVRERLWRRENHLCEIGNHIRSQIPPWNYENVHLFFFLEALERTMTKSFSLILLSNIPYPSTNF